MTSGVVALLLAARPELTPDQVKDVLTSTASPITARRSEHRKAQAAFSSPRRSLRRPPRRRSRLIADGLGSIEASRAGLHVTTDCNGVQTEISGEIDVHCEPWDPQAWTSGAVERRCVDRRLVEGRGLGRRQLEGRCVVRRDLGRRELEGRHVDLGLVAGLVGVDRRG